MRRIAALSAHKRETLSDVVSLKILLPTLVSSDFVSESRTADARGLGLIMFSLSSSVVLVTNSFASHHRCLPLIFHPTDRVGFLRFERDFQKPFEANDGAKQLRFYDVLLMNSLVSPLNPISGNGAICFRDGFLLSPLSRSPFGSIS